jgi:NADPH:quinone reductase-like Zn-dependent oxidoreductase
MALRVVPDPPPPGPGEIPVRIEASNVQYVDVLVLTHLRLLGRRDVCPPDDCGAVH